VRPSVGAPELELAVMLLPPLPLELAWVALLLVEPPVPAPEDELALFPALVAVEPPVEISRTVAVQEDVLTRIRTLEAKADLIG
jgi:hypothetical protein